ncbi:hypothetical protein D3OALGA1CA_1303 [Olavius algarvensis associated proteobacterium Delta 3]|nr:hypothetical protein D3OALGB2SA_625 [Olavius algarvensis associated proteobacterium Delta 3]CAB5098918.1 hypothetical protein D3OALGA1CA_1303 [Olavius algarvensis associated proteobacterium Delta 3]
MPAKKACPTRGHPPDPGQRIGCRRSRQTHREHITGGKFNANGALILPFPRYAGAVVDFERFFFLFIYFPIHDSICPVTKHTGNIPETGTL